MQYGAVFCGSGHVRRSSSGNAVRPAVSSAMTARFLPLVIAIFLAVSPLGGPAQAQPVSSYAQAMGAAQTAMLAGALDSAVAAGKQAYQTAPNDIERIRAARLVAAAHFRAQQYFRAEFWLRRAWQLAEGSPLAQAVASDFSGLRAANPLTVRLNFSAAPNSNINNGSQAETVTIWGLPFILNADARALAGYELSLGAEATYRLAPSANGQTWLGVRVNSRNYALTPTAAAAAPDVSGSDYAYASFEAFARHRWQSAALPGPTTFNASLGKTWYGGDPYTHFGRFSFDQEIPISQSTGGAISLGWERQFSDTTGSASSIALLNAQTATRLGNGDRLRFGIGLEKTVSNDIFAENDAVRLSVGYSLARPIWNANLSFDLGLEHREWGISVYDPSGRRDVALNLGLNAALPQASVYGFTPVVKVEARKSQSNISLFDRASYGLRLGLETQF